jgi:chromosome partitioning protein
MIISVVNQKGGVGKSSSVINIGAVLAASGHRVLLIDLDPQANLTQGYGVEESPNNIYSVIKGEHTVPQVITRRLGVDLIPAGANLKYADTEFSTRRMREFLLSGLLEPVTNDYDFILIDTQPNLNLLSENAIVASDYYLIPLQAEFFSMKGLEKMVNGVAELKRETRTGVKLAGAFLTRYNGRKKLCRDVAETIKDALGERFFSTYIRENVAISEAQSQGLPIFQYDLMREGTGKKKETSNGATDYIALTEELLTKINIHA